MSLVLCVMLKYLGACQRETVTQKILNVSDHGCEAVTVILLVTYVSSHTAATAILYSIVARKMDSVDRAQMSI